METQKSSVQAQTRDVRTDHARGAAVARRDGALVLALMRHIARGAECRLWSVADLRSQGPALPVGLERTGRMRGRGASDNCFTLADASWDRCKGYSWPQGSALPQHRIRNA